MQRLPTSLSVAIATPLRYQANGSLTEAMANSLRF